MSKRQKKKAPVVEEDPEVEVVTKTKTYMRTPSVYLVSNLNTNGGEYIG